MAKGTLKKFKKNSWEDQELEFERDYNKRQRAAARRSRQHEREQMTNDWSFNNA